jgi:oligopeptide transport system substrate-binding protein
MAGSEPAYGGFLPPAMPGHSHELALPFDLDRARALLAEAGYPGGKGPELRLAHADLGFGDDFRRGVESRWQSQWNELGVRIRQEWIASELLSAPAAERPHLWEWGWSADYPDPDGMLGTFLEMSGPSTTDPELKLLVARARSLRSRDERLGLYREVDRRLVAGHVEVVPLVYDAWFLVHRPWLHGLWVTPTQLGTLEQVVVRRPA